MYINFVILCNYYTSLKCKNEETERSVRYMFILQQEDLQEGQKYSGVASRKSDVGLVVIRDVSAMMPIHQSLGQAYT